MFQDFDRQIVVPVSKSYTSPGETLIITPVLYDLHQLSLDLDNDTIFAVSPEFDWLRWDHTKATSQVHGPITTDLPITWSTISAFGKGVEVQTRLTAKVKLHIAGKFVLANTNIPGIKTTNSMLTGGPISRLTGPNTTRDNKTSGTKKELEQCVLCRTFLNSVVLHSTPGVYGQPAQGARSIVVLWGRGFKEWITIVVIEDHLIAPLPGTSKPDIVPLTFENTQPNPRGSLGSPLVGTAIFRIAAEQDVSANYGAHSQGHRNICNGWETSLEVIPLFAESGARSEHRFAPFGAPDTRNGEILNSTWEPRTKDISLGSSASWANVVLEQALRQPTCFGCGFDEIITIDIHVGMKAVAGCDLREIKARSKAILSLGGLLNGIGLRPNQCNDECCLDLHEAPSIEDVAKFMNSPVESGYTYHGPPGPENQCYDLNFLARESAIVWTEIFRNPDCKKVTD
ncbi:hypothetical protein HOY80DRAFT_1102913 [Tuber brumale]|nr:hypothetical protein HOY80DRAFT_1102913 [Tuber brumale]